MDSWNGPVEWTRGMDSWNGLVEWTRGMRKREHVKLQPRGSVVDVHACSAGVTKSSSLSRQSRRCLAKSSLYIFVFSCYVQSNSYKLII